MKPRARRLDPKDILNPLNLITFPSSQLRIGRQVAQLVCKHRGHLGSTTGLGLGIHDHTHMCMRVCMCVCVYVQVCFCICVYIYICICSNLRIDLPLVTVLICTDLARLMWAWAEAFFHGLGRLNMATRMSYVDGLKTRSTPKLTRSL